VPFLSLLENLNALRRVHSFKRGRKSATNAIFAASRVKLLSGIYVTIELTTYTAEKWFGTHYQNQPKIQVSFKPYPGRPGSGLLSKKILFINISICFNVCRC
jgi:hypothetical protein